MAMQGGKGTDDDKKSNNNRNCLNMRINIRMFKRKWRS